MRPMPGQSNGPLFVNSNSVLLFGGYKTFPSFILIFPAMASLCINSVKVMTSMRFRMKSKGK